MSKKRLERTYIKSLSFWISFAKVIHIFGKTKFLMLKNLNANYFDLREWKESNLHLQISHINWNRTNDFTDTFTALCGLICSLLCIQSVAWPSSNTPIFFLTLSRSVESNNFSDKDLSAHCHHAHSAFETKFTRYRLCKPSVKGDPLLGTCAVLLLCCVPPYGSSQNPLLFTFWIFPTNTFH